MAKIQLEKKAREWKIQLEKKAREWKIQLEKWKNKSKQRRRQVKKTHPDAWFK
jgi:hypothetical protein